jgi:acyl-CoA reductase-like NAD-dependent aldehyde dehydrogenase
LIVITPTMTIDGAARVSTDRFDVVDPATDTTIGAAPDCPPELLDEAFRAADRAAPAWAVNDAARSDALRRAADIIDAAADELGEILTAEQGKPLAAARREPGTVARWLRHFADQPMPVEVLRPGPQRAVLERRPHGVVAAITPWNVPLTLAGWKLAPALRAGNTVVLKPSPFTPLATLRMGELVRDVFPPGVLNIVSGRDPLGAAMTSHPVPRKISFTGSVATGKHVAMSAAADLKRVTLELGGNDPAIVLDDADVATIAERLFWSAFVNTGQICAAVKRVFVHRSKYDELVDALAAVAATVIVGDGRDERTQMGPLTTAAQWTRVQELIDDAVAGGARVAAGGGRPARAGYFLEPAVLAVNHDAARIVAEEQFGPALPVLAFDTIDEAVRRANATPFGLTASVWGTDVERAGQVADRIRCGTSWVNAHMVMGPDLPFGGVGWSGIGVENGALALHEATVPHVAHRQ